MASKPGITTFSWITSNLEHAADGKCSVKSVTDQYNADFNKHGVKPLSKCWFGRQLFKVLSHTKRISAKSPYYLGIRWKGPITTGNFGTIECPTDFFQVISNDQTVREFGYKYPGITINGVQVVVNIEIGSNSAVSLSCLGQKFQPEIAGIPPFLDINSKEDMTCLFTCVRQLKLCCGYQTEHTMSLTNRNKVRREMWSVNGKEAINYRAPSCRGILGIKSATTTTTCHNCDSRRRFYSELEHDKTVHCSDEDSEDDDDDDDGTHCSDEDSDDDDNDDGTHCSDEDSEDDDDDDDDSTHCSDEDSKDDDDDGTILLNGRN